MEKTFSFQTEYLINYTTKKPVPIPDIIESLQCIERIIHRTPAFIEHKYKDISIVNVEVYIESLKAGSLKEKFIIKYVFKGKENYEKAQEVFDKMVEDSAVIKTLVAMGIGGLITYGAMSAIGSSAPSTHMEAYNNTIINIGGELDISSDDVKAIIKAAAKNQKKNAKDAIGVISPAKSDPDSTIEMSGISALTIDKDYIRDAPKEYEPPAPEEREEIYHDADIVIYASDRDKSDTAWAGIVPGLITKRIKFVLADEVDPAKLHGKISIKANITVISKFNKQKKRYEPQHVEITSVK